MPDRTLLGRDDRSQLPPATHKGETDWRWLCYLGFLLGGLAPIVFGVRLAQWLLHPGTYEYGNLLFFPYSAAISAYSSADVTGLSLAAFYLLPATWSVVATWRALKGLGAPRAVALLTSIPLACLAVFTFTAWRLNRGQRSAGFLLPPDALERIWITAVPVGFGGTLVLWLCTAWGAAYSNMLFFGLPLVIGFCAVLLDRCPAPYSWVRAYVAAMAALGACAAITLASAVEGFICIAMVAPIAGVAATTGGLAAGGLRITWEHLRRRTIVASAVGLLPMLMLAENVALPPAAVAPVTTTIDVAAPPERVWRHVVTFSELPEANEWYFRAGIAYPIRARMEGSGPGAVRYCDFTTGPFVEPITVRDEPRLLAFEVTHNPRPMNELSPWGEISPPHLDGYFVSKRGQFQLEPLPNRHTRLTGTTWYQHGLYPDAYWRLWSDAIIHRIHLRVLNHIKTLAEAPTRDNDDHPNRNHHSGANEASTSD